MKKLLLLSLFSLFCFFSTTAQWATCEPDLTYADSTFGVYPPPLNAANPDGGIPITACKDKDFSFALTLKVPQTIETDLLTITVDSIVVATSGAVTNLPTGMTYSMNPQDGVFTPEDSLACITIWGTPQEEGVFDLKIGLTIYGPELILVGGSQFFELPSPLIPDADGNYYLTVAPNDDPDCFESSTENILASSFSIRNLPNPFSDFTNIEIVADYSEELNFRVFDLIGNEIHRQTLQVHEGINNIEFDGSNLANGIYTYTIEKNGDFVTEKMVINR